MGPKAADEMLERDDALEAAMTTLWTHCAAGGKGTRRPSAVPVAGTSGLALTAVC